MAAGFVAAEGWASGKSPNTKIVVIGSGKNGLPIIVENPQDCFESTRCSSARISPEEPANWWVPSRHLIVRHARLGGSRASCWTEIG